MNRGSNTKQRRCGRRTLVTVVAGLAVLIVGGGVALATIPGSDGVIGDRPPISRVHNVRG